MTHIELAPGKPKPGFVFFFFSRALSGDIPIVLFISSLFFFGPALTNSWGVRSMSRLPITRRFSLAPQTWSSLAGRLYLCNPRQRTYLSNAPPFCIWRSSRIHLCLFMSGVDRFLSHFADIMRHTSEVSSLFTKQRPFDFVCQRFSETRWDVIRLNNKLPQPFLLGLRRRGGDSKLKCSVWLFANISGPKMII